MMSRARSALLIPVLFLSCSAGAACVIRNTDRTTTSPKSDALYAVLSTATDCPTSVQGMKAMLTTAGLRPQPYLVANRGRHNPGEGSFSFFETVSGGKARVAPDEFYFGHFTGKNGNRVSLDQAPAPGKLLIELILWDRIKRLYNFYEMIGTATAAEWFYRGDSADILADNRFVYRSPAPGAPKFGDRLRCSACHSSGGPILKELAPPHNDWWSRARPLPFGPNSPDPEMRSLLGQLEDTDHLAAAVRSGMQRLETSPAYQGARSRLSLQEQLRPLFCENEINLESDLRPAGAGAVVRVPTAFLANPLLTGPDVAPIVLPSATCASQLRARGLRFPETDRADADHAWLAPVKGRSDLLAIRSLVRRGVIDAEFAADVLAVDFRTPLFSSKRCELLRLLPETVSAGWPSLFRARLSASTREGASELLAHLTDPALTAIRHRERALAALDEVRKRSTDPALFDRLLWARQAVFQSEISRNPRGQILEPGFRVIFPVRGK